MGQEQVKQKDGYFVMEPNMSGGMLLAPIAKAPNRQSWTVGARFTAAPALPIVVKIREGYETAEPRPFVDVPPIMSDELLTVLRAAGVTNLDVYDAVLRSADGSVELKGYKAFNLIGLIKAADLAASTFAPGNPSRFLDASFDGLVIDEKKVKGVLMFRLAEHTSAVVVHGSIRAAIEAAGIAGIEFVQPTQFLS